MRAPTSGATTAGSWVDTKCDMSFAPSGAKYYVKLLFKGWTSPIFSDHKKTTPL
jgi:hypothetical protein